MSGNDWHLQLDAGTCYILVHVCQRAIPSKRSGQNEILLEYYIRKRAGRKLIGRKNTLSQTGTGGNNWAYGVYKNNAKSLVGEILSRNFWMAGHCGSDATGRVVRNCRGRYGPPIRRLTHFYAYDIRTQERRRCCSRIRTLYSKHRDERNLAAKTKIIGDL